MKEGVARLIKLTIQAFVVLVAFNLAVYFSHDGSFPARYVFGLPQLLSAVVIVKLLCFVLMHVLAGWWRYASVHDLILIVKANLLGSLVFALYLNTWHDAPYLVSNSAVVLDGLLCFLIMSGVCVSVRLCREYFTSAHKSCKRDTEKVLIVGAGAVGQSIARDIQQNPHLNWKVIGFVDQDEKRLGQRFQGLPVRAPITGLENLLRVMPVNLVLLANPTLCHKDLRRIVDVCRGHQVKAKILPNVASILDDGVSIHQVRDVSMEDLLGRASVSLDVENIRSYVAGKKILVSGAAGSIGSEICRQVSEFGAGCVILLDNAETPLFNIDRELSKKYPAIQYVARLNDVRDAWQVDNTFKTFRPDVVFHAAAYKHVPMSENNPLTAIGNNVIGTQILANTADLYHVKHFVMVSTDKAVNPSNVMGASKRAAEVYVQSLAKKSQTKMVTVRFGNVLGSNGSVVPIFQEQIRNGGPVTVTDPEVTRFFMTIPEAAQLVLQAGSMGLGGEIFVLDMGAQIKILDLAEELIRLSGMTPQKDIDIVFTGLRPGEKLHEELLHNSEGELRTTHEKIRVAQSRSHDFETTRTSFDDLSVACRTIDIQQAMSIIKSIVPEYVMEGKDVSAPRGDFDIRKSKIIKFPARALETV